MSRNKLKLSIKFYLNRFWTLLLRRRDGKVGAIAHFNAKFAEYFNRTFPSSPSLLFDDDDDESSAG